MDTKQLLAERLHKARELKSIKYGKKFTGEMVANMIGISRGFYGDMEYGRAQIPKYMIPKLIEILEVPHNYFEIDSGCTDSSYKKQSEFVDFEKLYIESVKLNIELQKKIEEAQHALSIIECAIKFYK